MRQSRSAQCPYIDKPCRVPEQSKGRVIGWPSLQEKAAWLDGASSLDSLRSGIQNVASHFGGNAEQRTRAIQRWVRDNVRYVFDYRTSVSSRGEEFADSETVLDRGYGDCDDKSRLFVALVRAAELRRPLRAMAAIRPVFKKHPIEFVHVQAEVIWPGSQLVPNSFRGGWLLVELILKGCEIGQNPDDCPRGADGRRLIA